MSSMTLRPHQAEAVDSVVRHLQSPAGSRLPSQGLRTQVIAATGSGKTLIAVEAARRLSARRVLVLVPTLDLLTQTAAAWRRGGRQGAMVGVCSLRAQDSEGIPCTTDPGELVSWTRELETVTVFATYAAVGLGILQQAHEAGLLVWDLMVVDEAHRTSGDAGRPWAAVHDQARMPAARRLYMTATARIWEAEGDQPRLVASMDEDSAVFGPVAYKLRLSEAIRRGLVAPYQVVCVDIRDPKLHTVLTAGPGNSGAVRGARLAALQTGLLTAAVEERLRRVLAFHSSVSEAEAMATGMPGVAAELGQAQADRFPPAGTVWANWLCGEHSPAHRRRVLDEFASDFLADAGGRDSDVPASVRVLSSVKVLGEGVDTNRCDAVFFCDARGSMVDVVQMVGRALRMHPGEGKLASLVVPVFLSPDEDPDDMLTSPAYGTLAKLLGALRAHDTDTIEALADPRSRSGRTDHAEADSLPEANEEDGQDDRGASTDSVSAAASGLLRFSETRDPAVLARFVRLRVIDPENTYWRRGIEAATRWLQETGNTELRVPYTYVVPASRPGVGGYPLGVWVADQRRAYADETLAAERVRELDALGMVWSAHDTAFATGLAVARAWAAAHDGMFLPSATAIGEGGFPIGVWAKNQRAAARRTLHNAERRAAGETIAATGELPQSRLAALEDIDPGWCPVGWDVAWQRCFRLALAHVQADQALPKATGSLVVQGEDLGAWAAAQQLVWDSLLPAQQWLLENTLGLKPMGEEKRPVRRTQDGQWALNLRAARQFHTREGHLTVPRKHVETISVGEGDGDQSVAVKLGAWLDNTRRRAANLTEQRRTDLDALDMRW
ncbi:Helicase associated domain protein [Streptomyces sp. NPDC002599]|uniref:DEAD/DEAH box helicase n=1 Tax=Streptomyces sp. NPDC002599 TaxID=3154421 RepID=UPI00331FCE1B